jgi:hypothetical protein
VVEALHATTRPGDELGASASVLHVTARAASTAVVPPVETGPRADPRGEGRVTGETAARAHLATLGVTALAALSSLEVSVTSRELTWRKNLRRSGLAPETHSGDESSDEKTFKAFFLSTRHQNS